MRGVGVDLDHRVAQRDRRAVPRRVGAVAQPGLGEVVAPLAVEELRDRLGQLTVGDARGHQALGRAARVLQAPAPVKGFGGAFFGPPRALALLVELVAPFGSGAPADRLVVVVLCYPEVPTPL